MYFSYVNIYYEPGQLVFSKIINGKNCKNLAVNKNICCKKMSCVHTISFLFSFLEVGVVMGGADNSKLVQLSRLDCATED